MKRITNNYFRGLFCLILVFVLAACGGQEEPTVDESLLPTRIATLAAEVFILPDPTATSVPLPSPTIEQIAPSAEITETESATETESLTEGEEITDTEELTNTAEISETAEITETESIIDAIGITETEEITDSEDVTDTDEGSATDALTGSTAITETEAVAETEEIIEEEAEEESVLLPTPTPTVRATATSRATATAEVTATVEDEATPSVIDTEVVTRAVVTTRTITITATATATVEVDTEAEPTEVVDEDAAEEEETPTVEPTDDAEGAVEPALEGLPEEILVAMADADPEHGQQLALTNACIGCHAVDPSITMAGPTWHNIGDVAATRVEGQSAGLYLYTSIVSPNEYVVEPYPPNLMLQIYGNLPDQDLADLVSYLLTLKAGA